MMFLKAQVRVMMGRSTRVTRVTALVFIGFWFVLQLFNGIASLGVETSQTGGVAYWAHIGGLVAGLAVGFLARMFPPLDEKRDALTRTA